MNTKKTNSKLSFISKILSSRYQANDSQKLPDAVLRQAIKGDTPLDQNEKGKLLNSPATLKRVQAMARQMQLSERDNSDYFIYRVADSASETFSIDSHQGQATLHITTGRKAYVLILKVTKDFRHKLQASEQQLSLKIGDIILPYKQVDAWGELSWEWQQVDSPRTVLQQYEGKIDLKIS